VEYQDTPPQLFTSQLNKFIRDIPIPRGFSATTNWKRVFSAEEQELEELSFIKIFRVCAQGS